MNECHLAVEENGSIVRVFGTFEAVVKLETVWRHMTVILIRCHSEHCPYSTRSAHVISRLPGFLGPVSLHLFQANRS